jgi:hypothetical protein
MYRFWTGEMLLGQLDGVVTTEAGFMSGREMVLVRYEPAIISLPNLIAAAEKKRLPPHGDCFGLSPSSCGGPKEAAQRHQARTTASFCGAGREGERMAAGRCQQGAELPHAGTGGSTEVITN